MIKKELIIGISIFILLIGALVIIYFLIPKKHPSQGCNTDKDCPNSETCINKVCVPKKEPPPSEKCVYINAWESAPPGYSCSDEQTGCKVKCCQKSV